MKNLVSVFTLISCLGCASLIQKKPDEIRGPASQSDAMRSIRQRFPTHEFQYFLKGKTKVKVNQVYMETECSIEVRDNSKSKSPIDYIRISGSFPKGSDLIRHSRTPEHYRLGASIGGSSPITLLKDSADIIDFESIRSSDWGGEVKERVLIEGSLANSNLKVRFITSPLTLGFALPFDETDMSCYNLEPL